MDRITRFSLRNGAAIVIIAILISAGGIWSAMSLRKESMPDVNIPVVAIVTPYPGAAPGDVFDDVTEPLEKAMRGVAGVKRVSATSGDSVSIVVCEFSFSEDMEKAEQNIAKALDAVTLPAMAMTPDVSRISFGSAPVLKIAIIGEGKTPAATEALRSQVRDSVIPALAGVEGVGKATLASDAPADILIEFDPEALEDEGLTADGVIQQLKAANLSFPVGTVDLGTTEESIRVSGALDSIEDIESFQVAVYPNQGKLMGEAFAQIGEGMGALGQAVGGLAKGMGALGQGIGGLAQGMGQIGEGMGSLGSATGEVAMQAGLINGMQQLQAQIYTLKYDTLPQLKAAASAMPTNTPEYAALSAQIASIETTALPGMNAAVAGMQSQITASQSRLRASAPTSGSSSGSGSSGMPSMSAGGMSMPSGGSGSSAEKPSLEPVIDVVLLSQVANVTYAPAEGSVGSRANGKPAALIDIVKTQDANTVELTEKVRTEMDRLGKDLPDNAKVEIVYDAATGINASIEGMMREGILGAVFAVIVIMLFLRNWRATLIATVSIPLSILFAMAFLGQTGVTLNVMTLGGLTVAIGRVVDDAIVVIENTFRHLQRGEARTPELIEKATAEVSSAITSSTLTTVAVFVPLGLVTGVIGKIFQPFAITVGLSLLASLLVAVTIVPLMARWMLLHGPVPAHSEEEESASKAMTWYRGMLTWSLDHRAIVSLVSVAVFAGSLALMPIIGTGFVPETKEKYLKIAVEYPQGTKATAVNGTVLGVEKALAEDESVELYQTTVGASTTGMSIDGDLGGTNKASIFVRLKTEADTEKVLASLQKKTDLLETEDAQITYTRVNSSGTNSALEVIVTGETLADIRSGCDTLVSEFSKMDGLENVTSNLGESRMQLAVNVNQEKAAEYGLNAAMVAGAVRGYVAEQDMGTVDIEGQPTKVKYVMALDKMDRAAEMRKLELSTPLGDTIKLSTIAKVEETGSPIAILTRNGTQYAAVSGQITERDTGSVISAVKKRIETTKLPAGVETEVSGAAEQMSESFTQLGMAMLVAVGAVYLVMIIAFGEATAPLAIMMSLPLAVVGGLVGLLVAGVPLDIPAMIGALMLIGIVVTNAIVLVDRVQQKQREGMPRREALMEAGSTRMRPILMTAVATIMALAPLASGFAEGALISQSLAVIVIGGLTTSTLLTLLVVPVAYDLLEGAKERMFGRAIHD